MVGKSAPAVCVLCLALLVSCSGANDVVGSRRRLLQFCLKARTRDSGTSLLGAFYMHPEIDGYKLDYCTRSTGECGQEAADEFCRKEGFEYAETFVPWQLAGLACGTTKAIGSSELCRGDCTGFRLIQCGVRGFLPQLNPTVPDTTAVEEEEGEVALGPAELEDTDPSLTEAALPPEEGQAVPGPMQIIEEPVVADESTPTPTLGSTTRVSSDGMTIITEEPLASDSQPSPDSDSDSEEVHQEAPEGSASDKAGQEGGGESDGKDSGDEGGGEAGEKAEATNQDEKQDGRDSGGKGKTEEQSGQRDEGEQGGEEVESGREDSEGGSNGEPGDGSDFSKDQSKEEKPEGESGAIMIEHPDIPLPPGEIVLPGQEGSSPQKDSEEEEEEDGSKKEPPAPPPEKSEGGGKGSGDEGAASCQTRGAASSKAGARVGCGVVMSQCGRSAAPKAGPEEQDVQNSPTRGLKQSVGTDECKKLYLSECESSAFDKADSACALILGEGPYADDSNSECQSAEDARALFKAEVKQSCETFMKGAFP